MPVRKVCCRVPVKAGFGEHVERAVVKRQIHDVTHPCRPRVDNSSRLLAVQCAPAQSQVRLTPLAAATAQSTFLPFSSTITW